MRRFDADGRVRFAGGETFIPEDSPQDPDYEQTKENLTLGVYEIEPSGVAVEIYWTDYELLNKDTSQEEEGGSS